MDQPQLADLQDKVGRALHPVIVGGKRYAARLRGLFGRYTIVDSTPFMKALHRQRAIEREGAIDWEPRTTTSSREAGAPLKHNIVEYSRMIEPTPVYQTSMFDVFEHAIAAREAVRASKQIRNRCICPTWSRHPRPETTRRCASNTRLRRGSGFLLW